MFISYQTLRTAHGRSLCSEPIAMVIPSAPAAALEFAFRIDRQADELLFEGRFAQAERLSHLALEARTRAAGERA